MTYASVVNIDIFQTYIPTGTPNLSIDGETNLDYNCRILLKDQASAEENGIYDFWDIGGGEFQFTRASDSNTKEEIFGSLVFVTLGTTNGKTSWANGNTDIDNFTLDDDNIVYYQFTGQTTYVAGDGLTLTGTTLDINLTNKLLFTGNAIDLPQAIDVASTPVFNGIDLTGQLGTTYTGAAPFHLQSASANFINTYLNADLLDGQHGSYYQPADADLTAIAALGYTATSFLKKTAANTWALDTNIYMTSNFFGVYSSNITLAAAANPFQGALACVINDDPILDLYVYVDYGDTFYWRKVSTLTNIPNI